MSKAKTLSTIASLLGIAVLLLLGKALIFDRQKNAFSILQVDATAKTAVFVNDQKVGETPYLNEKLAPGEYKLKVSDWGTKLTLLPNTLTYVSRNSGPTDEKSSGQILTLEKLISENDSEMIIVSTPDQSFVQLDGLNKGKTSMTISNLETKDHVIVVSLPGYSSEIVKARTIPGYRLNVIVKLAKIAIESGPTTSLLTSSPSAQAIVKPYVIIRPTPIGFLRVRSQPDINSTESAQVKPTETYPLIAETTGWVEIKLPQITGWVSEDYVDKVKD